ncbi:hypothetical protein KPH14_004142 [Odynerus spinipes]|uniref:Odorant receptor n=1 Tax=Odynerus spinipes TaxID=1348599 RepID=A0AAD9VVW1_9HYME|nr:hypothetical protein KPH14_004142 [Odynerus spinipes]
MSRNDELAYASRGYKFVTWLIGVWPLEDGRVFSNIRFAVVVMLLVSTISCLGLEILTNCGNSSEILEYIGLISGTTAGLTKVLFVKLHRSDLASIVYSAIKDWSYVEKGSRKEAMLKYARRAYTVGRFHFYFDMLIVITIIMDTLPSSDSVRSTSNGTFIEELKFRETPLRTNCLFVNASTPIYWLVFSWQSLQLFNVVLCDAGNDVFFFCMAMHLCGQFEVLKILYSEVAETTKDETSRKERLRELVGKHSRLLELAARLERTFNVILLVMLGNNALHICLLGVQVLVVLKMNEPITLMKCLIACALVLGQLFLYSYAGENLSSLSEEVGRVAYGFPWYELSSKISRNLLYVMMRANAPFRLTAGRFYTVNIESFKEVLKASFSYFSVLRLVFDE